MIVSPYQDETWKLHAACRGTAYALWFRKDSEAGGSSGEKARVMQAKAWCWRCPVQRECLTYALEWERPAPGKDGQNVYTVSRTPPFGIYGGFEARERHTRRVRHSDGCDPVTCAKARRGGCRPVKERVELLLGPSEQEVES